MFNLTVDEVKELSKNYNMIPLTIECYADMDTPIIFIFDGIIKVIIF